jgi:hypothetical protein
MLYIITIDKIGRYGCRDMLTLPTELTRRYEALLRQQGVAWEHQPYYLKPE